MYLFHKKTGKMRCDNCQWSSEQIKNPIPKHTPNPKSTTIYPSHSAECSYTNCKNRLAKFEHFYFCRKEGCPDRFKSLNDNDAICQRCYEKKALIKPHLDKGHSVIPFERKPQKGITYEVQCGRCWKTYKGPGISNIPNCYNCGQNFYPDKDSPDDEIVPPQPVNCIICKNFIFKGMKCDECDHRFCKDCYHTDRELHEKHDFKRVTRDKLN